MDAAYLRGPRRRAADQLRDAAGRGERAGLRAERASGAQDGGAAEPPAGPRPLRLPRRPGARQPDPERPTRLPHPHPGGPDRAAGPADAVARLDRTDLLRYVEPGGTGGAAVGADPADLPRIQQRGAGLPRAARGGDRRARAHRALYRGRRAGPGAAHPRGRDLGDAAGALRAGAGGSRRCSRRRSGRR